MSRIVATRVFCMPSPTPARKAIWSDPCRGLWLEGCSVCCLSPTPARPFGAIPFRARWGLVVNGKMSRMSSQARAAGPLSPEWEV
jgi:hypothetical protein